MVLQTLALNLILTYLGLRTSHKMGGSCLHSGGSCLHSGSSCLHGGGSWRRVFSTSSSRQTLLTDSFFGIKNFDYFFIESHKFLFFSRKYIKEMHVNCKIKHFLISKILKWRFWPSIKRWHIICIYSKMKSFI